jgi:hypothetical protein
MVDLRCSRESSGWFEKTRASLDLTVRSRTYVLELKDEINKKKEKEARGRGEKIY